VEFLPYAQVRRTLADHGIVEQVEGDRLRLALRDSATKGAARAACVVFGEGGLRNGARRIPMPADRAGETAERLLHKAHINDFVMIPAERWRPILDVIAFDLANNPDWHEVDADASLHQNTREPLGMMARQRALVREMLDSLHRNAPAGACDVTIAALDSPFVLEACPRGTLTLQCPEAIAETLVHALANA
jgi:hypothetical protein